MRMNKKGMSQLTDIVMSIILFTIFFAIIMIIGGSKLMEVHATIDAANTALLCQNDLNAVMEFPSAEGIKIKNVLVEDYLAKDYSTFEEEIKSYFEDIPGAGKWEIELLQEVADAEEPIRLHEFGKIEVKKNSQICNYFVPLPCDIDKCAMEVQLELTP